MTFSGISARTWRCFGGATLAGLLALTACGGGGTQADPFRPNRILSFGDEASAISPDPVTPTSTNARKYTINAVATDLNGNATTTYLCTANPIWIQAVASAFGLAFQQCAGTAGVTNSSTTVAVAGAKVADVISQIDTYLSRFSVTSLDLATVMVGTNDVVEQFLLFPGSDEATLTATLTARGIAMAEEINTLAQAGPAVVVSRIPDVGQTPFGRSRSGGAADAALLSRLTLAYNNALQLHLINDGHLIGLVFGDNTIMTMVTFPGNYGLTDVTDAACLKPTNVSFPPDDSYLLDCRNAPISLVPNATAVTYLWAGDTQLGPEGHAQLGAAAAQRAVNNPFSDQ